MQIAYNVVVVNMNMLYIFAKLLINVLLVKITFDAIYSAVFSAFGTE